MTTSRAVLSVLLAAAAVTAWPQTTVPAQAPTLPWALSEFGTGSWASRLPLLLARGWDQLPEHRLTEAEKAALTKKAVDEAVAALRKQSSQLVLDLDKKRIAGTLPSTEPAATQKALADIAAKIQLAEEGKSVAAPPDTMALKAVWPAGREGLPWPAADGAALAAQSKAWYVVAGAVNSVGEYLDVRLTLYSAVEGRVLASWQGRFAPDEAPAHMAEAADTLREALLGRAWSGLSLTSNVAGTRVGIGGEWHDLPWSSDALDPGPTELLIETPGLPRETRVVSLEASRRLPLSFERTAERDTIVLETEPAGALLYIDSRYIGPSPQTIGRPLAVTRVRAQSPGYATLAWEIGPRTPPISKGVLLPPSTPPSVPEAKDRFYWSLAAFSFSLTTTAFLGAWYQEQTLLVSEYAVASPFDLSNYNKAYDRYWVSRYAYGGAIGLTSAVFVWMMFELGAYLAADESTLP